MSDTAIAPESLPAENGRHVFRAAVIMPPITVVFVMLRFYSRLYVLRRRMALDDYVVAVTMCILIAHGVLMALATHHGMGLHIWQYTAEMHADYYFWLALSSEFYTASLFGFKTALLLLYLQIFGNNKKFRWACYITMVATWAYLTPALLTEFLGCWPPEKKWLGSQSPGRCMYDVPAKIFYGAGHFISDLVIGILPLTVIWKLPFSTLPQKLGFSVILSSGFIAMAVGISRWAIATYNMVSYDRTWWAGISFTLSILEPNLGLICACLATFSPLAHISYERGKAGDPEKGRKPPRSHNRTWNTAQDPKDHGVMEATISPADTGTFMYDLHGLQALEQASSVPSTASVQHPRQASIPSIHHSRDPARSGFYESEAVSPIHSEGPGTLSRYHPAQYQETRYEYEPSVQLTPPAVYHYPNTDTRDPSSQSPAYSSYGGGHAGAVGEQASVGTTAYYPEAEAYANYAWPQAVPAGYGQYAGPHEVSHSAAYSSDAFTPGGSRHLAATVGSERMGKQFEATAQRSADNDNQEPLVWANFSYPMPGRSESPRRQQQQQRMGW